MANGPSIRDVAFNLEVELSDKKSVEDVLKVKKTKDGVVNDYADGSTIIINADRLILNTKKDYLMLCGKEGVLMSSPKTIHIDADDDIYLFSNTELYLGLPNRGEFYDFAKQPTRKTKADPTPNVRYEPLVLGLKLMNWLEDLVVLLQQTVVNGAAGSSAMSPEMIENLKALSSRLPEIASTYAYIDGVSHRSTTPFTAATNAANLPSSERKEDGAPKTFGSTLGDPVYGNLSQQSAGIPSNVLEPTLFVNLPEIDIVAQSGSVETINPSTSLDEPV